MSGRALAAGAALALGSLLLLALAGELAARWILRAPPPDPDRAGLERLRGLDAPNLRGRFMGVPLRTNTHGFRGPDYAPRAAPGVRRIVVTGDSFVMGWGVREEESYPARLEALLEAEGDARYQVVNAGLADINIEGALDRLERAIAAYDPDVCVYGVTLNDIVGPAYERTDPPLRVLALAKRYRRYEDSPSRLLRLLWPRWVELREWMSPSIDYLAALRHNYFDNPAAWADFAAGLDRFAALTERGGSCPHLFVHTNLSRLEADHPFVPIYEKIERAGRRRGLPTTLSFPAFRGLRPSRVRFSASDGHPNPRGHAILAEALREGLRALPERCWESVPP